MSEEKLSRSWLGIASFVLSIIVALGTTINWWIIKNPETLSSELVRILGSLGMLYIIMCLTGFVLGVISLFTKTKNRTFGIVGTILSGLFLLMVGGFVFLPVNEASELVISEIGQ